MAKIPVLGSNFKVVCREGEGWVEYNRYISLLEATAKAVELIRAGIKAKVVKNIVTKMETEVKQHGNEESY